MRIGFFSDDRSGAQAALLANTAFNRHRPGEPEVACGSGNVLGSIPALLDAARTDGRDLMVAFPLARIHDVVLRARMDLAVVTAGPSPVCQAIARRAVAFDARGSRPPVAPAWLLAGPDAAPDETIRRLPGTPTPLTLQESVSLRAGCHCGRLHRLAFGLAAALRIAAEDPYADAVDPAEVAELLAPPGAWSASAIHATGLRDDLLDLAADLADGPPATAPIRRMNGLGCRRTQARSIRSPVHRRPTSYTANHEPHCAYTAGR